MRRLDRLLNIANHGNLCAGDASNEVARAERQASRREDAIMNMIRMLCGIVVIGIATSAATAQQDPIAARKALMKENGD